MTPKADALFEQHEWLLDPIELPAVRVKNPNSKWRMTSTWQKAIRRGDTDLARTMLAGLLSVDMNYAFRRIGVIAVEDIGLASYDLVMLAQHVGNLPVADPRRVKAIANMTTALCLAGKSRAVCDLTVATFDKRLFDLTAVFKHESEWVNTCVDFWKVFGTRKLPGSDDMPVYGGIGHKLVPDRLMELGLTRQCADDVVLLAAKPSMSGMPAAWAALIAGDQFQDIALDEQIDDPMPPFEMIGKYPTYAFDEHCMEGKRAIAYFRAACEPVRSWFEKHGITAKEKQMPMLNEAVFCLDSGVLSRRTQAHAEMRCLALSKRRCFAGMPAGVDPLDAANDLINLVRDNLETLNKSRRKVVTL